MKMKGVLFVLGQFAGIAAIAFTGSWLAKHPFLLLLETVGIALGIWAIFAMRKSQLRVVPEVGKNASLITSGPYQWLIHPMYTAVLLTTLALVLDSFTWFRCIVWIALLVTLIFKLRYEEQQLHQKFGDFFLEFVAQRHRLIPFIY